VLAPAYRTIYFIDLDLSLYVEKPGKAGETKEQRRAKLKPSADTVKTHI